MLIQLLSVLVHVMSSSSWKCCFCAQQGTPTTLAPPCPASCSTTDARNGTAKEHVLYQHHVKAQLLPRFHLPRQPAYDSTKLHGYELCLYKQACDEIPPLVPLLLPAKLGMCFSSCVTTRDFRVLLQEVLQLSAATCSLISLSPHQGFFFWHFT